MATEEQGKPPNPNTSGAPGTPDGGNKAQQQPAGEAQGGSPRKPGQQRRRAGTEALEKLTDKKQKIKDMTKPPGGFDATPLPDAPPGFTVKFTFRRAWNLPAADLRTHSADPFIHATLTADVPKRNAKDPLMTFRTTTIKRTTEPEWNEEWIVANVPSSGFTLKCRLYDEDDPDRNDRLGNVTIRVPHVAEDWEGFGPDGKTFMIKKRSGSKRAYVLKAAASAFSKTASLSPLLCVGIDVLGRSDPPHAQMYTVGPTTWVRHFSPMIGRLAGVKVNRDEGHDANGPIEPGGKETMKYDFQANEIQLAGPVPPKLYHRYVEFRPLIGMMFSSNGLRGRILNKALHKQHSRVYNYTSSTEYGSFEPRSSEASLQFLKMVHFDEGGRMFTYVLTLDGLLRFTETGKEFGVDLLSKHTMHSDVATYIACSGEFFVRHVGRSNATDGPEPDVGPSDPEHRVPEHPVVPNDDDDDDDDGGSEDAPLPHDPSHYQLIIDNDSGTYRPDKSILPLLQDFLRRNLPGLNVKAMDCGDDELARLKDEQREFKKNSGPRVNMVLNRSPSGSFSSSDESRLASLDGDEEDTAPRRSKKERAWDVVEDPRRLKNLKGALAGGAVAGGSGGAPPTERGEEER